MAKPNYAFDKRQKEIAKKKKKEEKRLLKAKSTDSQAPDIETTSETSDEQATNDNTI